MESTSHWSYSAALRELFPLVRELRPEGFAISAYVMDGAGWLASGRVLQQHHEAYLQDHFTGSQRDSTRTLARWGCDFLAHASESFGLFLLNKKIGPAGFRKYVLTNMATIWAWPKQWPRVVFLEQNEILTKSPGQSSAEAKGISAPISKPMREMFCLEERRCRRRRTQNSLHWPCVAYMSATVGYAG